MKHGLAPGEAGVAGTQAIRRAMDVVRAVALLQNTEATLAKVAQATGLSQSTAFRILRSLVQERALYFDEAARCYHLGVLLFELGLAAGVKSHVREFYAPVADAVAKKTGLSTYLVARSGCEVVCLLLSMGPFGKRAIPFEVGQRLPLGIGAGSLAILASLADDEIERIFASQAASYALFPGGAGEIERIRERIAATRASGFAASAGTVAKGICGVGVVIPQENSIMQLAMSVSVMADGINAAEARQFADIMRSAAMQVDFGRMARIRAEELAG